MDVRFWGTRGSVATPGPATNRYGGNTSCMEVQASETVAIFDCGTGARPLGASLAGRGARGGTHMFLTHVHWDHIQGFPFFLPILLPGTELDVYGAAALEQGLEEAMAGQMQHTYFPVRLAELRSRIAFHQVPEGSFPVGQFTIATQYLNHTCPTMGYRLFAGGRSVAYVTDHEPFWPHNPDLSVSLQDALVHPGDQRHVAFLVGADLLVHDAQYTSEEYPAKRGWGHGSWEYVVDVAVAAKVRQLALFHHDPSRGDDAVDAIVEQARERARARGSDMVVFAAAEGQQVSIEDTEAPLIRANDAPDQVSAPPAFVALLGPPDLRRALREALVEDGYPMAEAPLDNPELVRATGTPDLVVVSIPADGDPEKSLAPGAAAAQGRPVLAILNGDVTDDLVRCAAEFADDVMVAPFGPPNLRARVRALLGRRKVADAAPVARRAPPENLQMVDRLSNSELEAMLELGSDCGFRPGEILFRQGDRPTGLYYIRGGLIRLVVQAPDGRELTVGFAGPGDTVGEMGALDGSPRSATAVSLEMASASYIPRDAFVRALEQAPRTAVRLLRLMTQRLRDMDVRFAAHAQALPPGTMDGGDGAAIEHLQATIQRQSAVLDLSRTVIAELDRGRLFRTVSDRMAGVLNAGAAALFLVSDDGGDLFTELAGSEGAQSVRVPRGAGLTGHVANTGQVISVTNAEEDPRFDPAVDQRGSTTTVSLLCVPVRNLTGNILGVLQAVNRKDGQFLREDEELAEALGSQVAVAVGNVGLMEARRKDFEKSAVLLDVMRSLSTELELDQLLSRIMDKTTEVMQADRSSLFLVDPATNELWFKVAQGGAELREVRLPIGVGIAGHVAATGDTVNIPEAYEDTRFNPAVDRQTGYRTRTILCMPMRNMDGRIVGVLQVLNKRQGAFTREDEDLLEAVGSQAAIALQNASLFEEVVRVKNYNESILHSMATGVVALDLDGRIHTGNPAAERILCFTDGLPRGTLLQDAINGADNHELWDVTRHALNGDARQAQKLRYTAASGESVTMNISAVPLLDRKQDQSGVVLVIEDVSRELQLMGTLSRVVSRQVAEQLMASGGMPSIGGQRKQVTVLMADIRNFTTMSEASDPEEIVGMLNDYFGRMIDVIFRHEGTLDKFIGDAIMAVFGTPVAHDDDPLRAVKAGIDMRRALIQFNQERQAAGKMTIEIGIGICSGEAVSGAIGSEERMEFTVIGDTVNTAARLEGLTKNFPNHKIVFSESVEREIRGILPADFLVEEMMKGKTQSVRVFGITEELVHRTGTTRLITSAPRAGA